MSCDELFSKIDNFGAKTASDPLKAYLAMPILPAVADPIMYWQSQLAGGNPLTQMGLDFLSAPAASTDVEHAFL